MEFLPAKRRHCTGVRKAGSEFCGAHIKDGRIPCPVDPSHTIFARDADRHVQRCTKTTALARMTALPCYSRGINAGGAPADEVRAIALWRSSWDCIDADVAGSTPAAEPEDMTYAPAHAAQDPLALAKMLARTDLPVGALASRVGQWHATHCLDQGRRGEAWDEEAPDADSVVTLPRLPAPLPPVSGSSSDGGAGRHERQVRGIIAAMRRAGIIAGEGGTSRNQRLLLVEFGAGKGLLGTMVQREAAGAAGSSSGVVAELLLVERGANRSKADGRVQALPLPPDAAAGAEAGAARPSPPLHAPPHPRQRLRMDIADLALERHPAAWGVPLRDLVGLPVWVNAAGHDHAAELRAAAASAVSAATVPAPAPVAAAATSTAASSVPAAAAASIVPAGAGKRRRENASICNAGEVILTGSRERPADVGAAAASEAAAAAEAEAPPPADAPGDAPSPPGCARPPVLLCALGKHLCGGATDLALRCLARAVYGDAAVRWAAGDAPDTGEAAADASPPPPPPGLSGPPPSAHGIAIATCCHHLCTWDAFVGKRFFRDALGTGAAEFEALRMLSSWGCMPLHAAPQAAEAGDDTLGGLLAPTTSDAPPPVELDRAARIALGRRCKSLIDAGRVTFLQRLARLPKGAEVAGGGGTAFAGMQPYCSGLESPENMLLLLGPPAAAHSWQ